MASSRIPFFAKRGKSKLRKKGQGGESPALTYLIVFAVCSILLLVGLTKIYLQSQTTMLGLAWEKKELESRQIQKKSDNLMIDRERLMNGGYVLERARQIGLVPPQPGQVRKMTADTKIVGN